MIPKGVNMGQQHLGPIFQAEQRYAPLAEATLLKHRAVCSTLSSTETLHIACLLAQHTEKMVNKKQELKTSLGYTVNFTYEKKLGLSSAESVGSCMYSWVPCLIPTLRRFREGIRHLLGTASERPAWAV